MVSYCINHRNRPSCTSAELVVLSRRRTTRAARLLPSCIHPFVRTRVAARIADAVHFDFRVVQVYISMVPHPCRTDKTETLLRPIFTHPSIYFKLINMYFGHPHEAQRGTHRPENRAMPAHLNQLLTLKPSSFQYLSIFDTSDNPEDRSFQRCLWLCLFLYLFHAWPERRATTKKSHFQTLDTKCYSSRGCLYGFVHPASSGIRVVHERELFILQRSRADRPSGTLSRRPRRVNDRQFLEFDVIGAAYRGRTVRSRGELISARSFKKPRASTIEWPVKA